MPTPIAAGDEAVRRVLEFLAVTIENSNTREAYFHAQLWKVKSPAKAVSEETPVKVSVSLSGAVMTVLPPEEVAADKTAAKLTNSADGSEIVSWPAPLSCDAKSVIAAQLSQLEHELQQKTAEAAAATDLRAENTGLKERVVALTDEAARHAQLVVELDRRRQREHAAIRIDHEAVLAKKRKRIADLEARFGWLGVPVPDHNEGGK